MSPILDMSSDPWDCAPVPDISRILWWGLCPRDASIDAYVSASTPPPLCTYRPRHHHQYHSKSRGTEGSYKTRLQQQNEWPLLDYVVEILTHYSSPACYCCPVTLVVPQKPRPFTEADLGVVRDTPPGHNFFIFMQFWGEIVGWCVLKVGASPGKS